MKLVKFKIENFRCYRDEVSILFDDLTAIIGRNDVGKSALMDALAIFFEEAKLDKDDACLSGDRKQVRITCVFNDVPDRIVVDTDFATNLASEYLLNEDGELEIRKTYDGSLTTPKQTSVEAYANHPSAQGLNDLLKLKRTELIARAAEKGVDLSDVNRAAKAPIRAAIWSGAGELQVLPQFISLEEESGKQAWAALGPYLPGFALFKSDRASTDQDAEAQDPLKAAIREAIKAVEPKLLEVQKHVEDEVRKLADLTVAKLREMDSTLAETLNPVISTKKWDTLFQTSITGPDGVPLNKRGSGVKRLVLLNFFRAAAEKAATENHSGAIIYAIEEPETSQHPRNQRMLMSALSDLATAPGRQVIVTTHTPMLARSVPDTSLRFVEAGQGGRTIVGGGAGTNERIARSLGVLPDHNVKLFIGVEGKHDIAFLKGLSRALINDGANVPDLEILEQEGQIIFFPFGGSNLALWAARLAPLGRPEYHICDRDHAPPMRAKYQDHIDAVSLREDCSAVCTTKREMESYVHPEAVREAYRVNRIELNIPDAFDGFDDVPSIVAQAVHAASSDTPWPAEDPAKCRKKEGYAKAQLNNGAVARMTVERLAQTDPENEILGWYEHIGRQVVVAI